MSVFGNAVRRAECVENRIEDESPIYFDASPGGVWRNVSKFEMENHECLIRSYGEYPVLIINFGEKIVDDFRKKIKGGLHFIIDTRGFKRMSIPAGDSIRVTFIGTYDQNDMKEWTVKELKGASKTVIKQLEEFIKNN